MTPTRTGKSSSKKRRGYERYLKTKKGKEIYNRRSVTVEPLFEQIKSLFEMEPVWMRGKMNVAPLLLLCVYTYQLLLYYNVVKEQSLVKKSTGQRLVIANVKYIMDGL